MSNCSSRTRRLGGWIAAALLISGAVLGQDMTVFPANSPSAIAVGDDGTVWFADSREPAIVHIDVAGNVRTFPTPGFAPKAITVGPDGALWATDYDNVLRMTSSGVVSRIDSCVGGGFSSTPSAITTGPDRNIWFVDKGVSGIVQLTPAGVCRAFTVPGAAGRQWVLGEIHAGPDGNVWFTEPGINRIGRITPSGSITEFAMPRDGMVPNKIVAGSDGNLWFTESVAPPWNPNFGRISPTGEVTEFHLPQGATSIAAGVDGNLWLGWWGSLIRSTTNGAITVLPVGPEDWPIWPADLAQTPDGAIWIAEVYDDWDSLAGRITRFAFDTSDCVADGTTLCLDGGRFRITTEWRARDGSHGAGHATALTSGSGYFWFFDPSSVELVFKVLDGCSTNGYYWVFGAGLTNVAVTTRLTDTQTGLSGEYSNVQGTAFAPIQDTSAIPCR